MVRDLLVRGMLVGLVAGVLTFVFAELFGESQVDRAIAFEGQAATEHAAAGHSHAAGDGAEVELVSRGVQSTIGLATGVLAYGAAIGGLFALAFAFAHGRLGDLGPRATAALLAGVGFVAIFLVPAIKYPPNPPAIGDPATIGPRSGLFLLMILFSLAAAAMAMQLRPQLVVRFGRWNGTLLAGAAFLAAVAVVLLVLPGIDEVPDDFPATVLWRFRVASFGMQVVLWATLGLAFGAVAERYLTGRRGRPGVAAAARRV
jgi:predicted cobalt transporter CbtA